MVNRKVLNGMRIALNDKQMSSHLPVLLKAINETKGDICELGAGFYSTPFFHWLCRNREVVSYENNPDYFHFAKRFQTKNHRIRPMDEVDFDRHWSIVFIDHEAERRGADAIKFTNADLVILHDSEPEDNETYGYTQVWPHFKYRRDFIENRPHTTVLSNTIDVTKWSSLS